MSTLQTATPLVDLRVRNTSRPLEWFARLAAQGETELDVDQPYQRGDVWGNTRRRLLICSIMQGIPIGAIVINDRSTANFHEPAYGPRLPEPNRNSAVAIIDGKQRFTTIVKWLRSELAVPASWFPATEVSAVETTEDGDYARLGSLAIRQRRHFGNTSIPVVEATVKTLVEEECIFDLINFGGVAQGDTDT